MKNLPTLIGMMESFYNESFNCPKTNLNITYKGCEYVITRNNLTLLRIKDDETFDSEIGFNKDEVYKIVYDLFISYKEVVKNEFKDFISEPIDIWNEEAYLKAQQEKAHESHINFLNEQIEKGLRLLGLAVLNKEKDQIKLVKHDLKLLMKEFKS